ncbi:MAG: MoxR family ATPase, partial [Bacteroidota bacterium]
VEYPDPRKELRIIHKHLPGIQDRLAHQLIEMVNHLRKQKLDKSPGIAETIDWAKGLLALGYDELSGESLQKSIGCLLKSADDIRRLENQGLENLLSASNVS